MVYALLSGPGHTAERRLGNLVPARFKAQLKHLLELDRSLGIIERSIWLKAAEVWHFMMLCRREKATTHSSPRKTPSALR